MKTRSKLFHRLLLSACTLLIIVPCAVCLWVFGVRDAVFRESLPIYPRAIELPDAYGDRGGGEGLQQLHFWVADPFDDIRQYYEAFTPPFVKQEYRYGDKVAPYFLTVFNPSGTSIPVITAEFGGELNDPAQSLYCDYQLTYQCIQIELINYQPNETVNFPGLAGFWHSARTPTTWTPNLRGGTLIIYRYYVVELS
ncbi:MAG: hypothetical protein KF726_16730 [Anaerolineae bacterium]|nr:hypothetical protein [Anaerolineae bacterium]